MLACTDDLASNGSEAQILKHIRSETENQPAIHVTNKTPILAGRPIITVVIAMIRKNLSPILSGSSGVVLISSHWFFELVILNFDKKSKLHWNLAIKLFIPWFLPYISKCELWWLSNCHTFNKKSKRKSEKSKDSVLLSKTWKQCSLIRDV